MWMNKKFGFLMLEVLQWVKMAMITIFVGFNNIKLYDVFGAHN